MRTRSLALLVFLLALPAQAGKKKKGQDPDIRDVSAQLLGRALTSALCARDIRGIAAM